MFILKFFFFNQGTNYKLYIEAALYMYKNIKEHTTTLNKLDFKSSMFLFQCDVFNYSWS